MSLSIEHAIGLANIAHSGQVDKAGQPYILHPLRVGASLHAFGPDAVVAGILHDVVEDTHLTFASLLEVGVAPRALSAITACTKTTSERSLEAYEASIRRAMEDPLGLYVKAADVLDNAGRVHLLDDPALRSRLAAKYMMAADVLHERIRSFPTGGRVLAVWKDRPLTPPKGWTPNPG